MFETWHANLFPILKLLDTECAIASGNVILSPFTVIMFFGFSIEFDVNDPGLLS